MSMHSNSSKAYLTPHFQHLDFNLSSCTFKTCIKDHEGFEVGDECRHLKTGTAQHVHARTRIHTLASLCLKYKSSEPPQDARRTDKNSKGADRPSRVGFAAWDVCQRRISTITVYFYININFVHFQTPDPDKQYQCKLAHDFLSSSQLHFSVFPLSLNSSGLDFG